MEAKLAKVTPYINIYTPPSSLVSLFSLSDITSASFSSKYARCKFKPLCQGNETVILGNREFFARDVIQIQKSGTNLKVYLNTSKCLFL